MWLNAYLFYAAWAMRSSFGLCFVGAGRGGDGVSSLSDPGTKWALGTARGVGVADRGKSTYAKALWVFEVGDLGHWRTHEGYHSFPIRPEDKAVASRILEEGLERRREGHGCSVLDCARWALLFQGWCDSCRCNARMKFGA